MVSMILVRSVSRDVRLLTPSTPLALDSTFSLALSD